MEEIISKLQSPNHEIQNNAAEALRNFSSEDITTEIGILALEGAALDFPPREYDWQDSSQDLIWAVSKIPRPEYIPVLKENFPSYTDPGKEAALQLLANLDYREASIVFMNLIQSHAQNTNLSRLGIEPLISNPRDPEIFFPDLLEFADIQSLEWDVYHLLLTYLEKDLIESVDDPLYAESTLLSYLKHKEVLMAAQQSEGIGWMWEEDYIEERFITSLILDVMGYLPDPGIKEALHEALSNRDPRLIFFAAISLLKMGEEVKESTVHIVAADAEMRAWLYQKLDELNQLVLYPDEYYTQEAFAESHMVDWLTYPTELGQVPDEIELMEVVEIDTKTPDGVHEYYVYRFRTHSPHWAAEDGWMAGVSGPYLQSEGPSAITPGRTFSTFEPWDSKSPEEHVDEIRQIFEDWINQKIDNQGN